MPFATGNDITGGITLDLSWLNKSTVAADRSFVSLDTGLTWSDAYKNLSGSGLSFPGGHCGTTGVGGLTLGGGFSPFTPRVGFVADNVLNYEVVLANGSTVNANKTANSDLYMALKGGSSNFGVATRFDISAFENGKLWGGTVINPVSDEATTQLLGSLVRYTNDNYFDPDASLDINFSYNKTAGEPTVTNFITNTAGLDNTKSLTPFLHNNGLPQLLNTMRFTDIADLADESSSLWPKGYR